MDRTHSVVLRKLVDLESGLIFIENFLHVDNKRSNKKEDYDFKPMKIILENVVHTSVIRYDAINSSDFAKYLADPFFLMYIS